MATLGSDGDREARAATRSCGTCSLCCSVLRVDELKKPAGADCRHQLGDRGCGIYPRRPEICRAYQCLWRQGGLEDDERPDATGGIVDLESNGIGVRLGIRMRRLEDLDSSPALRAIAERYRNEMPIRLSDIDDVMNPDRPFRVLLPEGIEQRVMGDRVEVYHDGVRVDVKTMMWAERWARRFSIWWRNRGLQ
jgi:Fe-S-cluster containining protein